MSSGLHRGKPLAFCLRGVPRPQVRDLATVARHSGYRVKGMACEFGCSCRWLELFCHRRFALTPHAWLARLRDEEIQSLARAGVPAKGSLKLVGFADAASFCHSLKRVFRPAARSAASSQNKTSNITKP